MVDYWYPTNLISRAQMPVTKKKCENDPRFTYTGKEASPLGLGQAPHVFNVGDMMQGRDETMWMVAKRNEVNVWVRVPTQLSPSSDLKKDEPILKGEPSKVPKKVHIELDDDDDDSEDDAAAPAAPAAAKAEEPVAQDPKPKKVVKKKVDADATGATGEVKKSKKVVKKKVTIQTPKDAAADATDATDAEQGKTEPHNKDEADEAAEAAEQKPKKPAKPAKAAKKTEKTEPDGEGDVAVDGEDPKPKKSAKKTGTKTSATVKGKKTENEDDAEGKPAKPKKLSDYNLFIKVQTELAKANPDVMAMPGKERFKYVSEQASKLWKGMSKDEKAAAVAHLK